MRQRVQVIRPALDPRVRTELVLASDGGIYVALPDQPPERILRRRQFCGFALDPLEASILGSRRLFAWASTDLLALGNDGRIYVIESAMNRTAERPMFRGYRANAVEAARLIEELHRMAFNLTVTVTSQRNAPR